MARLIWPGAWRVLVTCKIGAPYSERRSCAVHAATCIRWVPVRMGGARNSQEWPDDSDSAGFDAEKRLAKPQTFDEIPGVTLLRLPTARSTKRVPPGQGRNDRRKDLYRHPAATIVRKV